MAAFHKKPKLNEKDYIFGTRAVIEAIHSGKEMDNIYIQKDVRNELVSELMDLCKERKVPFTKVPIEKLNRITRKNHQGVIAMVSAVSYASLDNVINDAYAKGKDPLILILDRITDVRNFGAIARSAECAGVDAIVIPFKGSAQINSDAVKTSAGALHYIPVCRENNLKGTVEYLQQNGLQVVACTEKGTELIYDMPMAQPLAIIMGSEEDGISNDLIRTADHLAKIPMTGKIASLNVSVSAAIAVFEAVRQRSINTNS
ncbi:23S rRNA (guanosine(2251)-2'-O)-methyltransferase RlmB [Marivirga arenosa]|uniref:23S rRNA (Guanosine(2251)-2'-O)-methyltransferase RlmB n=1 Tax=Marivirga arenosa TaxID=3059076 RepID=A0AA51N7T8_9BACT|nr:23S rRNA (guanosine(2251)-2'-O)-methyltransferase RlmB [Marivirga sp. ABR2-2]WMN07827.1 23S rRNA (guanosine(2251)-2'-O)-methyltransferase RlmB [Marivirga sp. ABR2-2]